MAKKKQRAGGRYRGRHNGNQNNRNPGGRMGGGRGGPRRRTPYHEGRREYEAPENGDYLPLTPGQSPPTSADRPRDGETTTWPAEIWCSASTSREAGRLLER